MKCIVCCEDKAPEIHFDVQVICSECARYQLQSMVNQIEAFQEPEFDAPSS